MNREIVISKLNDIIYGLLQITIPDTDTNLFSSSLNISPVNMVYLLLELEHTFPIKINDRFMDNLPCITIGHLADAICICSE